MSGGASASASLLKWVATFSTVSKCSSLDEFSDGLSFYQLLCELTPEHTSGVSIDRSGSSASVLKKDLEILEAWLEETFATKPDLNAVFSVSKLAAGSAGDITRLLEIILVAAVHSSKKDAIVNKILSMGEAEQHHLMSIIEETVGNIAVLTGAESGGAAAPGGADDSKAGSAAATDTKSAAAAPSSPGMSGLNASAGGDFDLSLENAGSSTRMSDYGSNDDNKKSQTAQIRQLKLDNAKLHDLLDDSSRQNRDLKKKLEGLKTDLEESSKSSKASFDTALAAAQTAADEKFRSEQNKNARVLKEQELIVADLKRDLAAANSSYDKLKRKYGEEMESAKKEIHTLHDETDLLKEKAKKLVSVELQLERYKKKLDAVGEVRAALTETEQQRNTDLEKILTLESEVKRIPELQKQLNKYKDEVVDLKTKLADSQSNEEHQKSETVKWKEQAQAAKKEHRAVSDALEQARAQLKAGAEPSITPIKSALSDQLSSDLKQRVMRLEIENKELRAAASSSGSGSGSATVAELTDQLDLSQRQLTTTQQKYSEAQKQIRDLKEQLTEAGSGSGTPSAAPAASNARSDAEISSLKKEVEALQSRLAVSQQATKQAQTQAAEAKAAVAAAEAKAATATAAAAGGGGSSSSSDAGAAANPTQVVLGNPSASQAVLLSKLEQAESYGRQIKVAYEKEHALYTAAAMKLKNSERQRMMFAEAINKLKSTIVQHEKDLKEREKIRLEEKQATKLEQRLLASAFYEIGFDFHSALLSGRAARRPGGLPTASGGAAINAAAPASSHHGGVGTATTASVAASNQPSPSKSFLAKQRSKATS